MGYNIGMVSLGCPKNQTDAETMLGIMKEYGHEIVTNAEDADVIIVNTCGFIQDAKEESINTLLELSALKEDKCKLLIATGCLAERYNTELLEELPEVDAVVGTGDYHKICEIIDDCFSGVRPCVFGNNNFTPPEGLARILSTPSHYAYLKISDGCDNNCTYCAIPMIRGKFRSRKIEDIVAEAKDLAQSGVKELILIAQDTTRYGIDLYGKFSLSDLLEELVKIDEIKWIRIHYFYTEAITDGLIDTMAKYDKICNYIDMPIQHINNRILKRMARRTNRDEIISKITKIREKMSDATIRTSLIVGFPGETEEEFLELYDFVKEIRFDRMGVFSYSQEEDTPAASFPDQIDEDIKKDRLDKLMALQQGISLSKNREKIGKTLEIIVEGYEEESYLFYGRSRADGAEIDGTVYFAAADEVQFGDIVNVKILDADEYDLTGEQVV